VVAGFNRSEDSCWPASAGLKARVRQKGGT